MILYRTYYEDRTEGRLVFPDGSEVKTLELPWKDNRPFVSCIPEGRYIVERDYTGRHQFYKILCVANRTHIEIHLANKVKELQGCIAPCMTIFNGVGFHSMVAMSKILNWYGENKFVLNIEEEKCL